MAQNIFFQPRTAPIYDVAIHIDKLSSLLQEGWKITLPTRSSGASRRISDLISAASIAEYHDCSIVGILGPCNRGKSFVFNSLCKTQLPNGRLHSADGLFMVGPREGSRHVAFMGTAGTDSPTKNETLEDKRAVEVLLREIMIRLCNYIIIVVNQLHLPDQIYMHEVMECCSKLQAYERPQIICIHNLSSLETDPDIERVIETEVIGILGAGLITTQPWGDQPNKDVRIYCSTMRDAIIYHFIIAKDGSPAGKKLNNQTFDNLLQILQADIRRRRNIRLFDEVLAYINAKFPQLFASNKYPPGDWLSMPIVKHETEPYIVLSELKDKTLNERMQFPASFSVSPRLTYDQHGYLVGLITFNNGTWQPRYRQYITENSVKIVIELAGCSYENTSIEIDKNTVVVQGRRNELAGTLENLAFEQHLYPIGPFELRVSTKFDIDNDVSEPHWDHGLLIITLPRRQDVRKVFGRKST